MTMRLSVRTVLIPPILLAGLLSAQAQSNCPAGDAETTAILALGIQNKLLAHKIAADDIEIDAPTDVGRDILMLRKTLDVATQAFFRCRVGDDVSPVVIQQKLAHFLHADQSSRDKNADRSDGIYGANLGVHIEATKGFPNSLFVVLTFDVECGNDNLLFLYTKEQGQWPQRLHWYSDRYTKPSDAFGDFFVFMPVRGAQGTTLFAVAHGHPWCTSRWSGFDIDLLRSTTKIANQTNLGHFSAGYDRGSDDPQGIKPTADGFTFQFWTNVAVPANDPTQMSGPLTLRFRTTSNTLECVSKDCPKK